MGAISESTKTMIESVGSVLEDMLAKTNARIDNVEQALNAHIHPPKPERPEDGEYWNIDWIGMEYGRTALVIKYPSHAGMGAEVLVRDVDYSRGDATKSERAWISPGSFNRRITHEEDIEIFWKGERD